MAVTLNNTGITFSDATTQNTAAVAGTVLSSVQFTSYNSRQIETNQPRNSLNTAFDYYSGLYGGTTSVTTYANDDAVILGGSAVPSANSVVCGFQAIFASNYNTSAFPGGVGYPDGDGDNTRTTTIQQQQIIFISQQNPGDKTRLKTRIVYRTIS